MTDREPPRTPNPADVLQTAALTTISTARTLLDLAERFARDPHGTVEALGRLAAMAKMGIEAVAHMPVPESPAAAPVPAADDEEATG